jgi:hypothetical protein
MGTGITARRSLSDLVEVTFEIQLVVFIDEIAGPDPDDFAIELQGRKLAAEFVAKQIRLAQAEGRDVTPVLNALAQAPASDYLRHMNRKMGSIDMAEAKLRFLENRPTLPDFYRRSPSAE